jgi:hypothetical protein
LSIPSEGAVLSVVWDSELCLEPKDGAGGSTEALTPALLVSTLLGGSGGCESIAIKDPPKNEKKADDSFALGKDLGELVEATCIAR